MLGPAQWFVDRYLTPKDPVWRRRTDLLVLWMLPFAAVAVVGHYVFHWW